MHSLLIAALLGVMATDPPPRTAAQEPAGKQVFDQSCRSCHGVRGVPSAIKKKQMRKLPVLDSAFMAQLTLPGVESLLKKGRGDMPPFDKELTAEQTAAVAKYVFDFVNAKPATAKAGK